MIACNLAYDHMIAIMCIFQEISVFKYYVLNKFILIKLKFKIKEIYVYNKVVISKNMRKPILGNYIMCISH